jgi:hypothetical protein
MNIPRPIIAAFTALALSACGQSQNSNQRYETITPPQWTSRFELTIAKRSCTVRDLKTGQSHTVTSAGTQLAEGFTADRSKRRCTITGPDNVICKYNTAERILNCVRPKSPTIAGS